MRDLWQCNLSHADILRALNKFEGYENLSSKQLKKLRLRNRFIHASHTEEQKELAREPALTEVRHRLEAGQSTQYVIVHAWANVRRFHARTYQANLIELA